MNCNCNKPKRCCGNIPVRTCCPNPTAITRTEFYDYKNTMKTDMKDLDDRISDKELDLSELELAVSKLELEKQNKLVAGTNVTLVDNPDDTTTINAEIDTDNYYNKTEIQAIANTKQDKLTAGANINIASNIISAELDSNIYYNKTEVDELLNEKQNTLTAGENITISASNEISAVGTHYEVGTEVKIGTWTESGTTYDVCRKVVDFGALPNAGDKDVPHGITDAVKFINLYAIADDGTNIRPIPFTSGTAATNQITLYANRTNVHIHAGTNRSDENAYVTIEYLKNQS